MYEIFMLTFAKSNERSTVLFNWENVWKNIMENIWKQLFFSFFSSKALQFWIILMVSLTFKFCWARILSTKQLWMKMPKHKNVFYSHTISIMFRKSTKNITFIPCIEPQYHCSLYSQQSGRGKKLMSAKLSKNVSW